MSARDKVVEVLTKYGIAGVGRVHVRTQDLDGLINALTALCRPVAVPIPIEEVEEEI